MIYKQGEKIPYKTIEKNHIFIKMNDGTMASIKTKYVKEYSSAPFIIVDGRKNNKISFYGTN